MPGPVRQFVSTLTLTTGTVGVEVTARVAVSVGSGVMLGDSVTTGSVTWTVTVRANAEAVAAKSASVVAVPGDWEGKLQAEVPRMRMQPMARIFFILFI
jgi:hypothetical protein